MFAVVSQGYQNPIPLLFAFALVFRQMFVVIQQKAEEYRGGIRKSGKSRKMGFRGSGVLGSRDRNCRLLAFMMLK